MQSRAEQFELYARECRRRADTATDPQAKAVFADMAVQWRELAAVLRSLRADASSGDRFFARNRPGPTKSDS